MHYSAFHKKSPPKNCSRAFDEKFATLLHDDFCNLLAYLAAFGTKPEGIDVPHLGSRVQTHVHPGALHFVVGLDNVGVERFPRA